MCKVWKDKETSVTCRCHKEMRSLCISARRALILCLSCTLILQVYFKHSFVIHIHVMFNPSRGLPCMVCDILQQSSERTFHLLWSTRLADLISGCKFSMKFKIFQVMLGQVVHGRFGLPDATDRQVFTNTDVPETQGSNPDQGKPSLQCSTAKPAHWIGILEFSVKADYWTGMHDLQKVGSRWNRPPCKAKLTHQQDLSWLHKLMKGTKISSMPVKLGGR